MGIVILSSMTFVVFDAVNAKLFPVNAHHVQNLVEVTIQDGINATTLYSE